MDNSILTVHVLQAEDLRSNESESNAQVEPYVILAIENQKIETRPVNALPNQIIWDEKFTFDITTGQEDLHVLIANKDVYASSDVIGKCAISLQMLRDQMKHDEWFELEAPVENIRQSNVAGSVHLIL